MLLDMVSYCHHQRLIPLMDAFPIWSVSYSLHTQKFILLDARSQQREKFPVLILTHLAHLFYYHFPLSLTRAKFIIQQ